MSFHRYIFYRKLYNNYKLFGGSVAVEAAAGGSAGLGGDEGGGAEVISLNPNNFSTNPAFIPILEYSQQILGIRTKILEETFPEINLQNIEYQGNHNLFDILTEFAKILLELGILIYYDPIKDPDMNSRLRFEGAYALILKKLFRLSSNNLEHRDHDLPKPKQCASILDDFTRCPNRCKITLCSYHINKLNDLHEIYKSYCTYNKLGTSIIPTIQGLEGIDPSITNLLYNLLCVISRIEISVKIGDCNNNHLKAIIHSFIDLKNSYDQFTSANRRKITIYQVFLSEFQKKKIQQKSLPELEPAPVVSGIDEENDDDEDEADKEGTGGAEEATTTDASVTEFVKKKKKKKRGKKKTVKKSLYDFLKSYFPYSLSIPETKSDIKEFDEFNASIKQLIDGMAIPEESFALVVDNLVLIIGKIPFYLTMQLSQRFHMSEEFIYRNLKISRRTTPTSISLRKTFLSMIRQSWQSQIQSASEINLNELITERRTRFEESYLSKIDSLQAIQPDLRELLRSRISYLANLMSDLGILFLRLRPCSIESLAQNERFPNIFPFCCPSSINFYRDMLRDEQTGLFIAVLYFSTLVDYVKIYKFELFKNIDYDICRSLKVNEDTVRTLGINPPIEQSSQGVPIHFSYEDRCVSYMHALEKIIEIILQIKNSYRQNLIKFLAKIILTIDSNLFTVLNSISLTEFTLFVFWLFYSIEYLKIKFNDQELTEICERLQTFISKIELNIEQCVFLMFIIFLSEDLPIAEVIRRMNINLDLLKARQYFVKNKDKIKQLILEKPEQSINLDIKVQVAQQHKIFFECTTTIVGYYVFTHDEIIFRSETPGDPNNGLPIFVVLQNSFGLDKIMTGDETTELFRRINS